jgi:antitoxin PrlF
MNEQTFFRSRLRQKGQITLPPEIRNALQAEDGDDLTFHIDESGRVVVDRARIIPPDQVWFWTERWQRMEREAQEDIEAGRVHHFESMDEALTMLDNAAGKADAEG